MSTHPPKKQAGFGIVTVLIVLIILSGIGFASYKVWKNSDSSAAIPQQEAAAQTKQESAEANSSFDPAATVKLKNYVSMLQTGINEYIANNSGKTPENIAIIRSSLDYEGFADWTNAGQITAGTPSAQTIYFAAGFVCDPATHLMTPAPTRRSTAIVVKLPAGAAYCAES